MPCLLRASRQKVSSLRAYLPALAQGLAGGMIDCLFEVWQTPRLKLNQAGLQGLSGCQSSWNYIRIPAR